MAECRSSGAREIAGMPPGSSVQSLGRGQGKQTSQPRQRLKLMGRSLPAGQPDQKAGTAAPFENFHIPRMDGDLPEKARCYLATSQSPAPRPNFSRSGTAKPSAAGPGFSF